MAQFIGSTISLVSKSDIRYIGKLEAINPEEATVSLSGGGVGRWRVWQ